MVQRVRVRRLDHASPEILHEHEDARVLDGIADIAMNPRADRIDQREQPGKLGVGNGGEESSVRAKQFSFRYLVE